ncbi:type 4a pilus biogenesis protein PilO [Desulfospira joergensenii]|uniref:type 4a pilus biogenesis protein PilO n=1 Tax=Desulfospira joergensenii TaxID=53329 RepID=UPI0003B45744|nr:type 4a pilus biogenesis protein PilO [Desulfospira joergensenii]
MAEDAAENKKDKLKEQLAGLFTKIGKLTRLQRLLICVGTFVLIGGAYFYFIYLPRSEELDRVKQEYKAQSEKLKTYQIKAKALAKWEKKMEEVQGEFNIATKALPDKRELPAMLTGVSKAGSNAGLEFLLFQPDAEQNKEFYKEIPLSMKVEGSYHQIANFFFQMAHMNRIINITNMSMKQKTQGPDLIEMSCTAVTYMFVDSSGKEQGKKTGKKKKRG